MRNTNTDKDLEAFFSERDEEHAEQSDMAASVAVRVIRCTEENAKEFSAVVRRWPELHTLVRRLQAAGLFPGLRALQITLTGREEFVAKGLGAVAAENEPQGR